MPYKKVFSSSIFVIKKTQDIYVGLLCTYTNVVMVCGLLGHRLVLSCKHASYRLQLSIIYHLVTRLSIWIMPYLTFYYTVNFIPIPVVLDWFSKFICSWADWCSSINQKSWQYLLYRHIYILYIYILLPWYLFRFQSFGTSLHWMAAIGSLWTFLDFKLM